MPRIEWVGGCGLLPFFGGFAAMGGVFGPIPTLEMMNGLHAGSILGLIVAAMVDGALQAQRQQ